MRILQVALVIAGIIPLALGLMNFLQGANAPWVPDGATPSTDNQLRFYAIWFTVPFFFALWMALNLDRALPIARILFGTMFLAGLARAYSISQVGWPEPPMIGAMIAEVLFILFVPWIAYVTRERSASAEI